MCDVLLKMSGSQWRLVVYYFQGTASAINVWLKYVDTELIISGCHLLNQTV